MNKCKSMFQHGQNYIVLESMIEEEKQRESEKKKTTGRFNIGGSGDKKIDDSIIRILPGQTKAVKEGEIIGDILSPVRNAIQLTKMDAIVQQDIQICDQENQHVPSKQNIMTDGSSSANLSDLHDYKQPSMNQLQIVDSGSEISIEQPPILNVNVTTQKIPQRKTVEVYKSKIDFYNKMGKMRKASNCSNLSSKDVSRSKSRPGSKQLSKKPSKTLISASTGALPVFMSSNLTKTPQKAQTRNQTKPDPFLTQNYVKGDISSVEVAKLAQTVKKNAKKQAAPILTKDQLKLMKQLEKNQRTTETMSNRKNVIDNYFKIGGLTVNDEQNRKSEMDQVYGNKTKK